MAGAAPATAVSTDTWRVVAVDEMVNVPAGTFSAVLIEKVGGTSTKRYWFARGVGKVKERSGAQLEELVNYTLAPLIVLSICDPERAAKGCMSVAESSASGVSSRMLGAPDSSATDSAVCQLPAGS
jgi:hypothetical protein